MPDEGTEGTVDLNLDDIETMSDEDLDRLAESLLGNSDDSNDDSGDAGDDAAAGDGSKDSQTPAPGSDGGVADDGTPDPSKPQEGATSVVPKGKELLDALKSDPEAQKAIEAQLNSWLRDASASAEAKQQQEEFERLINEGNFEEIGKRFVTTQQEQVRRSKVEEEVLKRAYGEIYGNLFDELGKYTLTDDEKSEIDPSKFADKSDAAFVLALSNMVARKQSGSNMEDMAKKRAEEILEALKNQKSSAAANGASPSSLPGATGESGNSGRDTSRDLISDGYREIFEEQANSRVMVP